MKTLFSSSKSVPCLVGCPIFSFLPYFNERLSKNFHRCFWLCWKTSISSKQALPFKVGVPPLLCTPLTLHLSDDCKKLHTNYAVNFRNCCDLSLLARSADNARWKGRYKDPIGLARLVETYEELSLPKGKVRRSNWETLLSAEQQECTEHPSI
jgi:hypothetical protein